MKARYIDPEREAIVEAEVGGDEVEGLIATILSFGSDRGHPGLELIRDDGSSLVLGTNGRLAVMAWTNSVGQGFHSVGEDPHAALLVYDHFGAWTEAPGETQVPLVEAKKCAERFIRDGAPDTTAVVFTPD